MCLLGDGDIEEACDLVFRRICMDGNIADNTGKICKVVKKINAEEFYCKFVEV